MFQNFVTGKSTAIKYLVVWKDLVTHGKMYNEIDEKCPSGIGKKKIKKKKNQSTDD